MNFWVLVVFVRFPEKPTRDDFFGCRGRFGIFEKFQPEAAGDYFFGSRDRFESFEKY